MPNLKIAGATIPIPAWTAQVLGLIAVVGITVGVWRHFYPSEAELVTVEQANRLLRAEIEEYNRHIVDIPVLTFDAPDNTVHLEAFADGCLVIARRFAGTSTTKLIVGPVASTSTATRPASAVDILLPPVLAAQSRQPVCLNPHPGEFQWRYGNRVDACWLEVWRRWPDGCEHVQMFNTCTGQWSANPDGSPQVRWTSCVH